MNDVFILGAGFSRAIGAEMPLMQDLANRVFQKVQLPFEKNFLTTFGNDIEMVLTYLAQDHPWLPEADNLRNRAVFLEIATAVKDILLDAMRETGREECPSWLLDLVTYWTENGCHVLTLNYDTLLESAARICTTVYAAGIPPNVYYPFRMEVADQWDSSFDYGVSEKDAGFTLYKLHGSINWLYSGSALVPGQSIYYSGLDDVWAEAEAASASKTRTGHLHQVPLIVPPVADKASYFQHPQLRGMWNGAAAALRHARRIFCRGYSLPITDVTIRFFLRRNQPAQACSFSVVDLFDNSQHFRKAIPGDCLEFDARYCSQDRPIPKFVESLISQAGSPSRLTPPPPIR